RMGGDSELLQSQVSEFLDSCTAEVAALREAIACRDAKQLHREAHKFQGHVGTFSETARQTTRRLDGLVQTGKLAEAERELLNLTGQVDRLQEALRRWLATASPGSTGSP